MYSPKISEELIPQLYLIAKKNNIPMTKLVNSILRTVLGNKGETDTSYKVQQRYNSLFHHKKDFSSL